MPLLPGKRNIGQNIQTELAAGAPRKQAIAIALNTARRSGANVHEKEPAGEAKKENEKKESKKREKEEMPGRGHHGAVKKSGGYMGY